MEPKKISPLFFIIGAVAVCVIVVIGVFIFSGKKNPEPTEKVVPIPVTPVPTLIPEPQITAPTSTKQSDLNVTVVKDSVLRSIDGGDSFLPYFTVATTTMKGGADILSIAFHPLVPDRVIVTTYQDGLFVNEGRINNWAPVPFPPKKIYSFILDKSNPNNRVFASGVVDKNGRMFRTDNAGKDWKAVYAEPGDNTYVSALAQHPKTTKVIFAGTSGGTIVKSVDSGNTWKNVKANVSGTVSGFAFDSTKTLFHYLLARGTIYYTTDGGTTWQDWEIERAAEVKALYGEAAAFAKSGDTVSAAKYKLKAENLQKKNTEGKRPPGIITIVADPKVSGKIYASASQGLWRSDDFGKYWLKLNIIESAERYPIRSVAVNPKNSREIVFVSGKTFYKSTNAGETWSLVPLNNPRNAAFVAYDPFDSSMIFVGLSAV